jgi:hypothetical protein
MRFYRLLVYELSAKTEVFRLGINAIGIGSRPEGEGNRLRNS